MLCLFKNIVLPPKVNLLGILISLFAASYWLYFSFIEKTLLNKIFDGQALFVDLLLALPLNIFFTLMVYAFSLWMYRFVFILIFRNKMHLYYKQEDAKDNIDEQEKALGENYWQESKSDTKNN